MPQPGIESLSDNLLSLMNKGVSAIQNIFFLKCAGQYGAYPHWHILLGMYGERQSDYDGMASLMRNLVHLTPPGRAAHSFVKCHRYSAYHRESERYFEEIAPAGFYRYIFPDSFNYGRLAYLFDVKWRTPHEEPVSYDGVIDAVDWWRRLWRAPKTPALYIEGSPDREMSLVDSRFERVVRVKMDQNEARVYDMMDDIVSVDELLDSASSFCERGAASRILDSFVGHGLAVRLDERCLGLALRSGYKEWSPDERIALMRN
ncbi:MAG: hypothetical protein LBT31_06030, partial [Synergistaceae bacterium]|jgi:hypothetical protein|nr:hypothetical protein [Synergistaceae bacterium]